MNIFSSRKKMSDIEYVKHIREQCQAKRKIRWIWLALALGMAYCVTEVWGMVQAFIEDFPEEKKFIYYGLSIGAAYGFLFTVLLGQAAFNLKIWIDQAQGNRTEMLMLKYYDKLKNRGVQP